MGSAADSRAGIRVCARFRPQNKLEQKHQAVECVRLQDGTAAHVHSEARGVPDDHTFTFDQVFGTTSSQLEVYEATAKPLVESALRGYNCTCFVYGQTGSGKTFSMEGVPGDADFEGIIPRVMADIFDGIQNMQADLEFIVRVSYIEIYMEKIRDLLKPTSTNLNVRESRERGVWIAGATEVCCASVEEMQEVMRLGGANRVISSTRMNNESSRSHSVFIITIEQRNTATGSMKSGKLFLVDLAGSEKVGKTHAKGQTLKEAQHINKSLSALGSVMNALTSGHPSTHIPYRDSKLTRLLQDSLGGNSETTLLVCASSSSYNSEETVSTLRFGTRAKSIKNKPKVNEERTVAEYKILVAEKDKRIASLEALLREAKRDATEPAESTLEEQLKVFATKVEQLEDDQASKAAELSSLEDRCAELETENKHLLEKEREVASIVSRNEDFSKKVAFLESELEAKAKECEDLSLMLARRRTAGETPPLSSDGISPVQATIEEGKELDSEKPPSSVPIVTERSRACSTALENELLRQQLAAKTNELKICTQRVDELTKELTSSRSEYDSKVEQLQQKLREFDAHLQGLGNPAAPMDTVGAKTKMLRSVRGGSRSSLLGRRSVSQDTTRLSSVSSIHRQDSTGSASSQSEWKLDDEVFPVAPIDMDSEVVQRLIRSMPEKGREKISKWLGFVLEGRDIRSNFHPEISIESLDEEVNRDIRRLIVPLLKNRRDLKVQLYVRTRYVRVSDLKITLDHEHKDEMRLEASSDDGTSEGTSAAPSSSLLWAKDHLFYGPKTDASSPSVLHASRKLASSKDRFISEPIDLGASVTGSRSMLPSSRTAQKLSRKASLPFDSFHASGSGPGSGGVFSRRLKTGMGAVLGDVKTKLNARYHKNHVHEDALCNGCGISPIVGAKWSCSTCVNYELCTSCYSAGTHGFEVNNEMCRRVEQLAVQKHRLLGEYPELFELFRRHVCNDNVIQFRRIVEWLSAIVSGRARSGEIYHKMIVKSGLHPDIRARLVAQLGALASQRTDISLKTEWFTESSADEDSLDSDDSEDSEPTEPAPAEPDGDALSPTSTFSPPDVKLETLRMYVMDASSSKQGSDPAAAAAALSDLLDPAVTDAPALRRTVSEASANSDHDEVRQLPDMQRKQSLDLPTYGRQQVKSITRLNL